MPTIPSVPATFTLTFPPEQGEQSCVFAIPAGVWASGTWRTSGIVDYAAVFPHQLTQQVRTAVGSVVMGVLAGFGAYDVSAAVSEAQIAEINAAAGGNLTAILRDVLPTGIGTDEVLLFTLTLVEDTDCSLSISPPSASYPASGGSGMVSVIDG